jgi:hypothetical protein
MIGFEGEFELARLLFRVRSKRWRVVCVTLRSWLRVLLSLTTGVGFE